MASRTRYPVNDPIQARRDEATPLPNPYVSAEQEQDTYEPALETPEHDEHLSDLHRRATAPSRRNAPMPSRTPARSQTLPTPAAHPAAPAPAPGMPIPEHQNEEDYENWTYTEHEDEHTLSPSMPQHESYLPPGPAMPMPSVSSGSPYNMPSAPQHQPSYPPVSSYSSHRNDLEMPMMPVPATDIRIPAPQDFPSPMDSTEPSPNQTHSNDDEKTQLLAQVASLEAALSELRAQTSTPPPGSATDSPTDDPERARLAEQVATLQAQLDSLESKANNTTTQTDSEREKLAAQVSQLQSSLAQTQAQARAASQAEAAKAERELAALRTQLSTAGQSSQRAESERRTLAAQVTALQSDLSSARTGATSESNRLAQQLAQAQAQLKNAEQSSARHNAELQAARAAASKAEERAQAAAKKAQAAEKMKVQQAERPPITKGGSHMGTEYTHMLLALDAVPFLHNALASAATWLLLAGFVVLPGTFSTLSTLETTNGTLEATAVRAVQNVSLFVVAWVLCGVGASTMLWLWYKYARNYVWLLSHIFTPGALNGLAGLASTLASVYGSQNGVFTHSSIPTLAATGGCAVICGLLAAWYTWVMLGRVKRAHEEAVGKEEAGAHGEGIVRAAKTVMNTKTTTAAPRY